MKEISSENEVVMVSIPLYRFEQLMEAEHRILVFNDFIQKQKYTPPFSDICSILGIPEKEEEDE
jgi:hypothetical protein